MRCKNPIYIYEIELSSIEQQRKDTIEISQNLKKLDLVGTISAPMDLERILKLDEDLFRHETDSDLQERLVGRRHPFQWEEHERQSHLQNQEEFIDEIHLIYDIADTPLDELMSYAKNKLLGCAYDEEEILKTLKKTKNIFKRQRAKNRRQNKQANKKYLEKEPQVSFSLSEQQLKKKKNRISAQISRDKKKQYFSNLILENEELKSTKRKLEKENIELKKLMCEGKNKQKRVKKALTQNDLLTTVGILSLLDDDRSSTENTNCNLMTQRQRAHFQRQLQIGQKKHRISTIISKFLHQTRKMDTEMVTVDTYEELSNRVRAFKEKFAWV